MKRKVKIVLHHHIDQNYETGNRGFSWPSFKSLGKSLGYGVLNGLVALSYAFGWVLVNAFKLPKTLAQAVKKNNFQYKNFDFKRAGSFALLMIIALVPIFALQVASEGQRISGRILGISDSLLGNVNSAQEAIKQQDYELAQSNFAGALSDLKIAQSELDQSSLFLRSIINFAPAGYNTGNVLKAAELLTESAQIGSGLLAQIEQFRFSPEGLTVVNTGKNTSARDALNQVRSDVAAVNLKLNEANALLAPLDSGALPAKYQAPLRDSQELIADLSSQMKSLSAATDLFTQILLGEKRFLVFLQNNNELRATGGFIGTIAQGKLQDASIKHLDIRSVYDLDGQLASWIVPPKPMRAVNNRWFMRDANWLASFAESSQRLSILYEKEGGETPDLILGITPDLFIDLLNKTGPITLPTYKVTISSSNFIEQIQTTTSVAYDKNLNQPKQLLADLYPLLLQKIGASNGSGLGMLSLLELFQKNLAAKNILAYSRDPNLQSQLTKFHWSGELIATHKDYLHINSSNLSGTKTDRSLKRNATLITTIQPDGAIINQVRYTITNPLPNSPGLTNTSFVRFYVPDNSRILAADGFDNITMPELPKDKGYVNDSVIEQWNRDLQFDDAHNVFFGKESGKMFIANWFKVAGGETKTVTVTYQLPFKIDNPDNYSLYWQKQAGMLPFEISQEIIFPDRSLIWDNFGNQNRGVEKPSSDKSIWRQQSFNQDQFIGVVIKAK
ncbi:DUF4012 domain-containing protein [bacterium]|nr:MAG: DUF4012 domain-containing protein [bacterium]